MAIRTLLANMAACPSYKSILDAEDGLAFHFNELCKAALGLQATVDKLSKTRDGVSVVPGVDQVFDGRPDTCHCFGGATDNPDRSQLIGLDIVISADGGRPTPDGGVPWKHAYSTADAAREAAEAASETNEPAAVGGVAP